MATKPLSSAAARRICLLCLLVLPAAARANGVLDWNAIVVQTIGTGATATPPRAGPSTPGDTAKVHAAMHDAIQAIETDAMAFSVTSAVGPLVQKTRSFAHFSEAASEVVEARILLGIHFRFADTEVRRPGRRVADWAFARFLRPLDD